MTDIQSKEVIDKISDELKIQPALKVPRAISKNIQIVYSVNSNNTNGFWVRNSRNATGATTLFTTPTDRDFYLTSAFLGYTKDVLSDGVLTNMTAFAKNQANQVVLEIVFEPLTAEHDHVSQNFNPPILLERGTTIVITSAFAAGAQLINGTISGYTTDPQ